MVIKVGQNVRILKREKGHSEPILHLDLILKKVSDQSHAEVEMLLVGLPFWYFFGMLVRLDTDLTHFLDMAYIFSIYYFCLFPFYELVILCNLISHYMILLYYMIAFILYYILLNVFIV